ncbi:MAG: glycosyltransferase family 2 protein [Phenylobacterium sp.]
MSEASPGGRSRRGRTLSLVIPMLDEAAGLDALFARLDVATASLGVALEIICVDDGSGDSTFEDLRLRAAGDRRLRVISLSRNFGKEAALTAGLEAASGDLVVAIDADLQDPPELIAEFLTLWEQGYDVVYGLRADRGADTAGKRLTAGLFYRLFNSLSDHRIPPGAGDFRLMDRQVVEAIKRLPERNRFMKGLFSWVGFRQVGVPYTRPARVEGTTSWGYWKLWRLAADGLTSFSIAPLRVWTAVGLVAAALAVLYALALVVRVLVMGRDVPGYASLMAVVLFGFALQMIALGVIGEYVGRIYEEVKRRPLYMVARRLGFDD